MTDDAHRADAGKARVRAGVALVSVWFEPDDLAVVPRARITTVIGTHNVRRASWAAAGDEEILRVIRVWLARLRGRSDGAVTLAGRIGDGDGTEDTDRE